MAAKCVELETLPIFTINDFPTEIIERFAPDLRPRTVSTLRLVSRRFRDVFSADRYYRSYLCYPDRAELYRRDMEGIGYDEVDRWKRCLEAEKLQLANWRNGRNTRVDTVAIPSDLRPARSRVFQEIPFEWHCKIGEENERWMLLECLHQKIVLLNVTGDPFLTVVDLNTFSLKPADYAALLPDQVMVDSGTGSKRVFNIAKEGENVSLEYLFMIEALNELGLSLSGKSKVTGAYRSLYVSYKNEPTDAVLRVFDLKGAVELEQIDLCELLSPKYVLDLRQSCTLKVSKADEFPHVLVNLKFEQNDSKWSVSAVVNVEERRLALCFGLVKGLDLYSLVFKGNTVCVEYFDQGPCRWVVRVYDLRMHPVLGADKPGLLYKYDSKDVVNVQYEPPALILSNQYSPSKIRRVMCSDGYDASLREINFADTSDRTVARFLIGPFLLVERRSYAVGTNEERFQLFTYDISGKVMFEWGKMLLEKGVVRKMTNICVTFGMDPDFHSLSKCIVQNEKGDNLYICYF